MEAKRVVSVGIIVFLSLASLSLAIVPWKDCGSVKSKISEVKLNVACTNDCPLPQGTSVTVDVTFTPNMTVTDLTAVVHGIIAGVPISFSIPNPKACTGSGLVCPLKPSKTVTYKAVIPVKKFYPKVKLLVKWELKDKSSKDVFCFVLPAEIV